MTFCPIELEFYSTLTIILFFFKLQIVNSCPICRKLSVATFCPWHFVCDFLSYDSLSYLSKNVSCDFLSCDILSVTFCLWLFVLWLSVLHSLVKYSTGTRTKDLSHLISKVLYNEMNRKNKKTSYQSVYAICQYMLCS